MDYTLIEHEVSFAAIVAPEPKNCMYIISLLLVAAQLTQTSLSFQDNPRTTLTLKVYVFFHSILEMNI